jgi:hypothetical protein
MHGFLRHVPRIFGPGGESAPRQTNLALTPARVKGHRLSCKVGATYAGDPAPMSGLLKIS